jgi:hypothetical protein
VLVAGIVFFITWMAIQVVDVIAILISYLSDLKYEKSATDEIAFYILMSNDDITIVR